jgi:hypothetical protein
MRASTVALSALLLGGLLTSAAAEAATTSDQSSADPGRPAYIQVATGNSLGDKYLTGKSGGRYGVGGTESAVKSQAAKPPSATPPSSTSPSAPPPVTKPQQ